LARTPRITFPGSRPSSTLLNVRAGDATLDETGLDGLLVFDDPRLRTDGRDEVLIGGPWKPLTVTERLGLQRRLARAEFLARTRSRLSW
jgi:hypothetical protein